MKTLKNFFIITVSQRKAVAVLLMALTLTNNQVFAAQENNLITLANQTIMTQDAPAPVPEVVPAVQPTVQEVLLNVCQTNGYGEDCAKTLLGMLWKESSNRSTVIGDNGRARGYFQIHYKLHKIPVACAEDLVCSANWTITYLERNSYPKYVSYAVQCHNSCNVNNGYAAKSLSLGRYFWNKPLEIKQAAPIKLSTEIAMK